MFNDARQNFVTLIVCVILLIALLSTFIIAMIYKYQQRQQKYFKELDDLKTAHENTLLQSMLEMQEQTFQHISREIHDNIGQKLTLAKLYMNTLSYGDTDKTKLAVKDSLDLISSSIESLSDISRSMSSELILNNGLVKGIETEINNLNKSLLYTAHFSITGREVFLSGNAELVIFRIMQECINNFIKHAGGSTISIHLNYSADKLLLQVKDDGKGFDTTAFAAGSGINNMRKRAAILGGQCDFTSGKNGTTINIKIPINENSSKEKTGIGR